jgi:hypothetical protein
MYRVIDTSVYSDAVLRHQPQFAERGTGILAVLDPEEIREPPPSEAPLKNRPTTEFAPSVTL